jgi:ethanolaminephosphotransferase
MFYLYGCSTEGLVDNWYCYLLGVSYFVYSTLDNLDGK